MASFLDSVRTVCCCKNVMLKFMFISAILSYPLYQVLSGPFKGWGDIWSIISIFAAIFYLGYIINASSNLINERNELFVGFLNPFKIFAAGFGGIIVLLPVSVGMYYAGISLYSALIERALPVQAVVLTVFFVEVVLLGVLAVQMMLYAHKYNPISGYNILEILKTFPDFSIKSISAIFGVVFWGAIATGVFLIPVYKIFPESGFLLFILIVFFLTYILAFLTNFYAQIALEKIVLARKIEYDEGADSILDEKLISKDNKKKKKKKKVKKK